MTDEKRESVPPENKNLRTRIAAVLYAMDCDDYDIQAGEELDPSVFWAIREGAERRADAVIRELPTAYVVTSGSYSDYEVKRVYLTREEAEQFIELRGTVRGYDECRIEEFPIGAGRAEYDGPGYRAFWSMSHDGTESEHLNETWLTGSYLRPVEKRGIQRNYRRFVMVEGIDRDQVLKVLRDAATQGRAEYEGVKQRSHISDGR